jgi:hypothetical protein
MAESSSSGLPPSGIYEPLKSTEIRLINIKKCEGSTISCQIEHVDTTDKPVYYALSYVWGVTGQTKQISLNNHFINITENLFAALSYLQDTSREFSRFSSKENHSNEIWIWADALCIDQQNQKEKSEQIPKMSEIYTSAASVVV